MIPAGFDEVLHTPNRLRICVVLSEVERAEFGLIRDTIGVADSVLSKQLRVLVDAGYIELDKPTGRGPSATHVGVAHSHRTAGAGAAPGSAAGDGGGLAGGSG